MSTRRRILRIALVLFVILAVAGYGALSTFLLNPFEGAYAFDLSTLIPRDVEFYVSKADLEGDFDPFPHLAVLDDLEAGRGGQALASTEAYRDLRARMDLEPTMAEIEAVLSQSPVDVSPLGLFGGRDLAIAGYFAGADLAQAKWAVYGRTNLIGRIAVELLRYPETLGLSDQGFVVDEVLDEGEVVGHSLSGGELAVPLHITRVLDVVVISNDVDLIRQARRFDAGRGEDSLGLSAKYGDHIDVENRSGEELELFVNQRKLAENMGWSGDWPDAYDQDSFLTAFWGKLFQIGFVNEIVGSCSFDNGVALRLHAPLSSDKMSKQQKRLYRQRGFERRKGQQAARLAPADAGLFLYMHGDIGDLLRMFVDSLDEEVLGLIEDRVSEVWGYTDTLPLIEDIDAAFRDQFAFIVRNHDYPPEQGDNVPPHDDTPVLSWALVLWPKDGEKLRQIEKRIRDRQGAFQIQGRNPGSPGVMENTLDGGSKIFEYWNPFMPGTGMIATLAISADEEFFVVSNSHDFLNDINSTFYRREGARPQLALQSYFQSYVLGGLSSANAVLWLNPRAITESMHAIAEFQAGMDVISGIDWEQERPKIRRRLLRENWPDEDPGAVSPEVEPQLELLYDQEAERYQREYVAEHGRLLRDEYVRRVEEWEVMECALLQLAIDPKAFDLMLRVYLPFD